MAHARHGRSSDRPDAARRGRPARARPRPAAPARQTAAEDEPGWEGRTAAEPSVSATGTALTTTFSR